MNWSNIEFHNPEFLWLLLAIPVFAIWYFLIRKKDTAVLTIPNAKGFKAKASILSKLKPLLYILRLLAIIFLLVALARPQNVSVTSKIKSNKGIDIVMAIDISASMLAKDLRPNRLDALKDVASDFIKGRPNDRIGLVLYAGESYTKTPITSDKSIVLGSLGDVKYDGASSRSTDTSRNTARLRKLRWRCRAFSVYRRPRP